MYNRWIPLVLALASEPAWAGFLLSPRVNWTHFSARPEDGEPTPNYVGFGAGLSIGYSIAQKVDLAGFGNYVPGRIGEAKFMADDASLAIYGGEVAARAYESVYVALRGGLGEYGLQKETRTEEGDELTGRWTGAAGGVAIGAIHKVGKQHFFQTTVEIFHAVLESDAGDNAALGKRRFDSFGVSFAYVFNHRENYLIKNDMFKSFLDTMIFF